MSQNNDILSAEEAARQAEELTAEAFEALENGQGTRVAEICAELRVMHYSSCFEIEALLALDQGLPRARARSFGRRSGLRGPICGNCGSCAATFCPTAGSGKRRSIPINARWH